MTKYKITYCKNGDRLIKTVEAESRVEAKIRFYMSTLCDDIISIEEVKDNV